MSLRSKRGEWDLLGLGVELRPQQVSLLREDTGVALVPMRVPDPGAGTCLYECGERNHFMTDENPHTGLSEPVVIPGILRYDTGVGVQAALDSMRADQELVEGFDLFPLLVGDLSIPLSSMPIQQIEWPLFMDDEPKSVRVLWDGWLITEAQAADIEYHVALSLLGSDYEQMLELVADEHSDGELDAERAADMTLLLETGDLTPYVSLPPHLAVIWERLLRSSRSNWAAIGDATRTDPLRPWAPRPERMFSPWY